MKLLRLLIVVLALAGTVARPRPAAAHEGQGQFAVETAEPVAAGVRYVVRLTWVGDNHPAIDATVTATPIDPAGTAGTPVAFTAVDQDGRYRGDVPLPTPGRWTVRFTAVTPPATFEATREVTAPTTAPSSTTTTVPADSPATTEAGAPLSSTDGGDGSSAGTLVFVAVVAAIVLGGALAFRSARRRSAP